MIMSFLVTKIGKPNHHDDGPALYGPHPPLLPDDHTANRLQPHRWLRRSQVPRCLRGSPQDASLLQGALHQRSRDQRLAADPDDAGRFTRDRRALDGLHAGNRVLGGVPHHHRDRAGAQAGQRQKAGAGAGQAAADGRQAHQGVGGDGADRRDCGGQQAAVQGAGEDQEDRERRCRAAGEAEQNLSERQCAGRCLDR